MQQQFDNRQFGHRICPRHVRRLTPCVPPSRTGRFPRPDFGGFVQEVAFDLARSAGSESISQSIGTSGLRPWTLASRPATQGLAVCRNPLRASHQ